VENVLSSVKQLAGEALQAALASVQASAAHYANQTGQPIMPSDWQPNVYTYAEVKEQAIWREGQSFQARLEELEIQQASQAEMDIPAVCKRLTETAWAFRCLNV
jgi:arginine utilization protein RocB